MNEGRRVDEEGGGAVAAGRGFSVGALAREAGVSVQSVRWYEEQGLLPRAARTAGGQRRFDERALKRLLFISHARKLGIALEDIRRLLALADNPEAPCREADEIIGAQLAQVREKIAALRALEREFVRMLEECPSGQVRECRVMEVLSDHAQCLHEEH